MQSGFPKKSVDVISKFQMAEANASLNFRGASECPAMLECFGGNVHTKGADLRKGPRLYAFEAATGGRTSGLERILGFLTVDAKRD
jgi:hypothetical protein